MLATPRLSSIVFHLFLLAATMPCALMLRSLDESGFLWKEGLFVTILLFGVLCGLFLVLRLFLRQNDAYILLLVVVFLSFNYVLIQKVLLDYSMITLYASAIASLLIIIVMSVGLFLLHQKRPDSRLLLRNCLLILIYVYVATPVSMMGIAAEPIDSPRFVFAHIFPPHNPPVFDRNGGLLPQMHLFDNACCPEPRRYVVEGKEVTWRIDRPAYIEQIHYVNQRLLEFIDAAQQHAKRPVVIVILGDHGPNSLLDWEKPSPEGLRERFAILHAVYFSDGNYTTLEKQPESVNLFRIILNQYLGYSLPMLDEKVYFSNYLTPYDFKDVTDIVK